MKERWYEMSKQEKLQLMAGSLKAAERKPVMERVEKYLRGKSMRDPTFVTNVVLREAWRHKHGDTREWDRMAAVAGKRF